MGNQAVHFDLVVGNKQNEKEFYNQVFEWTFEDGDGDLPDGYEIISGLMSPSGGMKLPKDATPKLLLFFHVESIAVTLAKVVQANPTSAVSSTMDHPLGGKYAWFTDPEGILIAIYEGSDVPSMNP